MTSKPTTLPAKRKSTAPAQAEKNKQTHLVSILKTDHNFDVVKEILEHIGFIKRSKKTKPQEKHRLLQNYYLTLLSYSFPKLKVVQDDSDKNSKPMAFTINIGGTAENQKTSKKAKGMSITIPTKKARDGTYSIDQGDTHDV